ncbi:MAG: hypothetical protein ABIJ08_04705 [Nanoarchaeota archaeon]
MKKIIKKILILIFIISLLCNFVSAKQQEQGGGLLTSIGNFFSGIFDAVVDAFEYVFGINDVWAGTNDLGINNMPPAGMLQNEEVVNTNSNPDSGSTNINTGGYTLTVPEYEGPTLNHGFNFEDDDYPDIDFTSIDDNGDFVQGDGVMANTNNNDPILISEFGMPMPLDPYYGDLPIVDRQWIEDQRDNYITPDPARQLPPLSQSVVDVFNTLPLGLGDVALSGLRGWISQYETPEGPPTSIRAPPSNLPSASAPSTLDISLTNDINLQLGADVNLGRALEGDILGGVQPYVGLQIGFGP